MKQQGRKEGDIMFFRKRIVGGKGGRNP